MWSDSGARPGSAGGASADPVAFAHRLQQAEQALHEEVATQLECLRTCMALAVDGYYPISLTALHVLNRGAAHGAEGHQQQQLPPPRRRKTARSGSDHNGGGDGVTVWTTGSGEVMEEGQAMQRGALGLVENDHLRLLWLQELDSRLTALMEGRSSL